MTLNIVLGIWTSSYLTEYSRPAAHNSSEMQCVASMNVLEKLEIKLSTWLCADFLQWPPQGLHSKIILKKLKNGYREASHLKHGS